jgi:hypothetical protein
VDAGTPQAIRAGLIREPFYEVLVPSTYTEAKLANIATGNFCMVRHASTRHQGRVLMSDNAQRHPSIGACARACLRALLDSHRRRCCLPPLRVPALSLTATCTHAPRERERERERHRHRETLHGRPH